MRIILIAISVILVSCSKRSNSVKSVAVDEVKIEHVTEMSNKDLDMIVSKWYLMQYTAVEELERITKNEINVGGKVSVSPNSLLSKQRGAILNYKKFKGDLTSFAIWENIQEKISEELFSSVGLKISPIPQNYAPDEKLFYHINEQEKLIDRLYSIAAD